MFGRRDAKGDFLPAEMELLRLAIPRRVYTQSHIDYVIEIFGYLAKNKKSLKGLEIVEAPKVLAHFTAKLRPVGAQANRGKRIANREGVPNI
jgi:tryptophanase